MSFEPTRLERTPLSVRAAGVIAALGPIVTFGACCSAPQHGMFSRYAVEWGDVASTVWLGACVASLGLGLLIARVATVRTPGAVILCGLALGALGGRTLGLGPARSGWGTVRVAGSDTLYLATQQDSGACELALLDCDVPLYAECRRGKDAELTMEITLQCHGSNRFVVRGARLEGDVIRVDVNDVALRIPLASREAGERLRQPAPIVR